MPINGLQPSSWMTRAEKRVFRTLAEALPGSSEGFSPTKADALADYIEARSRIDALRKMWRETAAKASFQPNEKHAMALARQIDATTSLSHRIARDLGLDELTKEP